MQVLPVQDPPTDVEAVREQVVSYPASQDQEETKRAHMSQHTEEHITRTLGSTEQRCAPQGILNHSKDPIGSPGGIPSQDNAEVKGEAGKSGPTLEQPVAKGWRFWMVFPPICISTLFAALEATVTSTALPTISAVLNAGDEYTWYANAYLLTTAVSMPVYGQLAFVFGRKKPIMLAVSIFMVGSGISGGATSSAMLIAGRAIQGCGSGGITVLNQLIISDLVSVRDRGKYMGVIFSVYGLGTSLGPIVGGFIVQQGGDAWRWVFWLNLPICAATLILQAIFLQITYQKIFTFRQKMKQIDWVGSFILVGSVLAVLIALSWADTRYSWNNWRILFPIVIGFIGWAAFHAWEASPWVGRPTVSPKVFSTRTSSICLGLTFCQSMLTFWRLYFLPVYFQSVLQVSPGRSGVLLLPSVVTAVPTAIIAGQILSRLGRYKPIHLWGFGVTTLGIGLYINLDASSSLAKIVLYQMITGLGNGVLLTTMLPAIQAVLPPSETAAATSTWGFTRSYGNIWGIAIPTAIFNSRMARLLPTIPDPDVRRTLGGGDAYSHVSGGYIASLPPTTRQAVVDAYEDSLRLVWEVCIAICAACFLLCFLEKEVAMRTTVNNDFGLKRKKKVSDIEKKSPS